MLRVAIVGIRGVPNNYGGFETLAEYLAEYLSTEMQLSIYCSSIDMPYKLATYKGAVLQYVSVSSHGFWGILYDSICLCKAIRHNDRIILLGFGAGFILPFIGKANRKLIVNFGGLDWQRVKWSYIARRIIKLSESLLIRYAASIIADNEGIQEYILNTYGRHSTLIAYGGDQSQLQAITEAATKKYPFLIKPYCFSVSRIQPDNNIEMILRCFIQVNTLQLVLVGNWNNSEYGKRLKEQYSSCEKIILIDAIYDRDELDMLRSNCTIYIHGHSAGGTNPSLVEAMYLGLPVFAYNSIYNQFTTEGKALFFQNESELVTLLQKSNLIDLYTVANNLKQIALKKYIWRIITQQYKIEIYSGFEN